MMNEKTFMLGALHQACSEQCPSPLLSSPTQVTNQGEVCSLTPEKAQLQKLLNNGPVEIRANDGEKWWSGVFNDYGAIKQELIFAMKRGMDIYNTVNPIALPVTNGLKPRQKSAKDDDVIRITTIPFDFDPVRAKGEAATDDQITQCMEMAKRLIDYLGWGDPVQGMSGNGWHLLYETDLLRDRDTIKTLKDLYMALAMRFSTDSVKFDTVVRNPARIMRTYGTVNQKSGRKTYCIQPDQRLIVKGDAVIELAKSLIPDKPTRQWVRPAKPETSRSGYIKNLDIAGLFVNNGLYLQETNEAGKHWVLCPWEDEHTETGHTDTVVWEGTWPQFHCSHDHCSHRTILDVITFFGVAA